MKNLGYYVFVEKASDKRMNYRYSYLLETCSSEKALIGTYFWGHGSSPDENGRSRWLVGADGMPQLYYDDFKLSYKIKFAYIYACYSNAGKNAFNSFLWFGYDGMHYPLNPWNPDYTDPFYNM